MNNIIQPNLSRNNKKKYDDNIKYPFIKMKIGNYKDSSYFSGKIKNSNKIINNQIGQLLYTGFQGTDEDFKNIYAKKEPIKLLKNLKSKLKINKSLMINAGYTSKSMNFSDNNNKSKTSKMISLLNKLRKKENNEKNIEINKDKSTIYLPTKNASSIFIDTYKNNTNKTNSIHGRNSTIEIQNKIKRIKKIRNILNEKSEEILALENYSLQDSKLKNDISYIIPNINLETNNKTIMSKSTNTKNIKSNSCKSTEEKIIYNINYVFKKYLKEKKDDTKKLQKVLDPLHAGFKSNFREMQNFMGNNRLNVWMKKSTANLISFGTAFQLMADDMFYKNHKSIIGKYPELEKEAQILLPPSKIKDNTRILKKLKKNERKIRFIVNDSDVLLKEINKMNRENKLIKSQSLFFIRHKKEKNKF